uniref:Uncharacterized protein n=1 Tax=Candidatus Methanophagaceae archaeon ANME-1 ERB6 TaxID=2759912 RepID=A0A7G9YSB2_9EURY|nr:hypothetical protein LELLBOIK_00011 [Methanosarcinales archaeon ANME-1 ERB6]
MQVIYIHLKVRKIIKTTVKFQPNGGIYKPSSSISCYMKFRLHKRGKKNVQF